MPKFLSALKISPEMVKSPLFKGILLAFDVIFIDQLSKYWVNTIAQFKINETVTVFPGFDITLRYNTGAAFSFLADSGGWQRWFFMALAIFISIVIIFWLSRLKPQEKMERWGLGLILGGALGNAIDRIIHGHVIDFLLFYYKTWEWPAFNIADVAISLGAFLFAWSIFRKD